MERAVRKWRGQFRKIKLHLEGKIGKKIPPDHPMVPWMISWSGDAIMKYHVREDGRTAYETMTGHRVKHVVAGFGEHVHFKVAKDTVQNKYEGEWAEGFFARVITRSSEYLVIQDEHIFKCPTIRRKVAADAYKPECVEGMRADFFEYIKKGASTTRLEVHKGGGKKTTEMPKPEERIAQPRSVRIRESDLEQFGYTAGCAGCAWYSDKLGPHRGHSAECRTRLEEIIENTEEGKSRVETAKAKKEKHSEGKDKTTNDGCDVGEGEKVPPEGERSSGSSGMSGVSQTIMSACLRGVDITEMYSPERINQVCHEFGLNKGTPFDLRSGWDFDKDADRREAWKQIRAEDPLFIIGSPPCTMFSALQTFNPALKGHDAQATNKFREELGKARRQ